MIYIVSALYAEASPFIHALSLKKELQHPAFQVFSNESVKVILSNTGMISSAIATTYLLTSNPPKDTDIICNLGCCASYETTTPIGSLYLCHEVTNTVTDFTYYPDMIYEHDLAEARLFTVSRKNEIPSQITLENSNIVSTDTTLIDMEGAGFYESARIFFPPHRIFLLKLVSDYLNDSMTSSQQIEELFHSKAKRMIEFLTTMSEAQTSHEILFSQEEQNIISFLIEKLELSETMQHQVIQLMKYIKLRGNVLTTLLEPYCLELQHKQFQHKREGKMYVEQLKRALLS